MRKLFFLDNYFPTGEATIQPLLLWHAGKGYTDAHGGISKHASEALDYIKSVQPQPGKTALLVLALGAGEHYGPNKNGDGFSERPVPARKKKGYFVEPGQELKEHYKTFEKGHVFQHHQNKDPSKASGIVKKAFYNDKMHRVELLLELDNKKDPEWVQRVNDGDFPAVSMGCKIAYDVCSVCGNKARTRAQYCDHAKYAMLQLNEDGTRNFVWNPSPNFFDISRVFRPADKQGYTLKKVAHEAPYELASSAVLGEFLDVQDAKKATIQKISDIEKIIRGEPVAFARRLEPAEANLVNKYHGFIRDKMREGGAPLDEMRKHKPADVFATLSKVGHILSTPDFIRYVIPILAGRDINVPEQYVKNATALQGEIIDLIGDHPELLDDMIGTNLLKEGETQPELEGKFKIAGMGSYLYRNVAPEGTPLRPNLEAPTTDVMSITDPAGQQYQTNRGAVRDAHDAISRQQWMNLLGSGAMLAGAYKLLRGAPRLNSWRVPAGLALGGLGLTGILPDYGTQTRTDQGNMVSSMTELAPDQLRTAELVESFTRDYSPSYKELSNCVLNTIKDNTKLAHIIENLASYHTKTGYINLENFVKDAQEITDSIYMLTGTKLDFEKVAAKVGEIVLGL